MLLIAGAVLAIWSAWNVPRAVFWVALGAFLYAASAMWHNYGLPHGAFFGAGTNLFICLLMGIYADQKWEMRLWNFYHLMIVIDILFIFGFIQDKFIFAASLELVNLLALAFIIGTGAVERNAGIADGRFGNSGVNSLYPALFSQRAAWSRPPWQR